MTTIVDGNAILREIQAEVTRELAAASAASGIVPRIAIVQSGQDPAAALYTRRLSRVFQAAGFTVDVVDIDADASPETARSTLAKLSADPGIQGIQIQTPLPAHLSTSALVDVLDPRKDLDGIHPVNAGLLAQGTPDVVPATPLGGIEILQRHGVAMEGVNAVVVGRSPTVGRPMAMLLLLQHATVTICHTRTRDLGAITQSAEILACAAGRPGLITADMVQPGAAVIDFGVNVVDGKVVGDVVPEAAERAGLFTPMPGGTGPVTNAMLLRNALTLYRRVVGAEQ
ncbi:MAG: bifunctional 5,10-methylenetetrahydrofolate dehydrogenase/5,10-methenyltetrahydrofolate cyclohydrolase [Chloroflexi bacterium]|nr:bifunctional 5,10-methylenetetrahydrofolate dehydrogenase/5,10-methenyltetrahydrofolate cyclohydrolase [Chloroflexota bacterium]